jgi:hypothetical protein
VETSLGSGIPSHLLSGDVPCPSIPSHGFLPHTIGSPLTLLYIHDNTNLEMLKYHSSDLIKSGNRLLF